MKKGFSLLFLLLLFGTALAQGETAEPENVAASDPFVGTVTYSIFWKGPNTGLWAKQLPNSMDLTASGGNLKVQVYGGVSDSLLNEYIWLEASGEFYLVDHRNAAIYSNPPDMGPVKLKKKALPSSENAREIIGYACDGYRFSGNGNPDTYWLSPKLVLPIGELPDSVYHPPFINSQLKMVPLRMERNVNGVQVITEATKITQGADPITLPSGYAEKPFFKHTARHPYFNDKSE